MQKVFFSWLKLNTLFSVYMPWIQRYVKKKEILEIVKEQTEDIPMLRLCEILVCIENYTANSKFRSL